MKIDIRRATREELSEVGTLLEANGLPPLPRAIALSNVLVALEQGAVIGVVTLEVVARWGFTRWTTVAQAHEAGGVRASLLRSLIARTHELGLRAIYLLTETAPKIFGDLGFAPVSQEEVPREVQTIRSYRDVDAGTAEVLRLELETRI